MTAREDIEALATALEEEARDARENADDLEARAEALRKVIQGMEAPASDAPASFTSIGHTTREQLAHDSGDDDLRTYQDKRVKR